MRRVRKFLGLAASDRHLLLEATLLVAATRLGLWLLPFRTLRHLLDSLTRPAPTGGQAAPERVAWAVSVASRYIPAATCLTQALATQALLGRRGHRSRLRIGVAKAERGQLEAHAWVELEGNVVIGGAQDIAQYAVLPILEVP